MNRNNGNSCAAGCVRTACWWPRGAGRFGVWGWKAGRRARRPAPRASGQYEQLVAHSRRTTCPPSPHWPTSWPRNTAHRLRRARSAHRRTARGREQPDTAALARLQKIMPPRRSRMALLVRLRIARLQIDQASRGGVATLAAAEPGAFAGRYAEVRGDALWQGRCRLRARPTAKRRRRSWRAWRGYAGAENRGPHVGAMRL